MTQGDAGSAPMPGSQPVAWAVAPRANDEIDCEFVYPCEYTAGDVALDAGGVVVPLYRQPQPTLTDAEHLALCRARDAYAANSDDEECVEIAIAIRGLLERLG